MTTPTIVAIWIKRAHGGPMDPVEHARLVEGEGIETNADYGHPRHITLIEEEAWRAACEKLGADVPPTARRANVLVRGISLGESAGKTLQLGECVIEIKGETRPCELMDRAHAGLKDALSPPWRAGAWGKIAEGGEIRVGDPIRWK